MHNNLKLYGGFFFIIIVLLIAGLVYRGFTITPKDETPEINPTTQKISNNYTENFGNILDAYSNDVVVVNQEDLLPLTADTIEKLLELRVPADSKDLHLAVILSLNSLKTGLTSGDSEQVLQAISRFNELVPQYSLNLPIQ